MASRAKQHPGEFMAIEQRHKQARKRADRRKTGAGAETESARISANRAGGDPSLDVGVRGDGAEAWRRGCLKNSRASTIPPLQGRQIRAGGERAL